MKFGKTGTALCLALAAGVAAAWLLARLEPAPEATLSDLAGRPPQRIIPMAPNIAETVFALGAGNRVVAVSSYTTHPPEALAKPTVGALFDPDLERIVALQPDLMIIQQKHEKVEALCQERGIPVLRVEMVSLAGIVEGIQKIGARIGAEREAERLAAEILNALDRTARRVQGRPRVRVFLCLGRQPGSLKGLFTVGGPGFLSELIGVAGGENVFADLGRDFPQVSVESLNVRAPEVILETYPSETLTPGKRNRLKADWAALPDLPAVRSGRIHIMTEDYLLLPGPRIVRTAERFADALHGEKSDER